MSYGRRSILAIGGAPLIVCGAMLLSASTLLSGPARTALVLPLAMLLPGWAVLRGVGSSSDRRDVGLVIGLSAMLSIALIVLIALGMSAASVPLRTGNFVISLDVVLAMLALLVYVRERVVRSRTGERQASAEQVGSRVRNRRIAIAVAAAVVGGTGAMLLTTYSSVRPLEANENPWIGLSLVGAPAHTNSALRRAPGEGVQLQVKVTNRTRTGQKVRILLQVDGGSFRPAHSQVVGPSAGALEQVGLSAPRQAGLHHVVLAIDGASGVPGASVGTWILVGPRDA